MLEEKLFCYGWLDNTKLCATGDSITCSGWIECYIYAILFIFLLIFDLIVQYGHSSGRFWGRRRIVYELVERREILTSCWPKASSPVKRKFLPAENFINIRWKTVHEYSSPLEANFQKDIKKKHIHNGICYQCSCIYVFKYSKQASLSSTTPS